MSSILTFKLCDQIVTTLHTKRNNSVQIETKTRPIGKAVQMAKTTIFRDFGRMA